MDSVHNSSQADAALALWPMYIPGWKTPVLPTGAYHGGIPLSIHSPSIRLYMVIDPFKTLSKPLAVNDSVELWVNDQPTSVIKIIKAGEENDRIDMELPWGWLVNGDNTMFYRVTRPSGNFDDSTPVLDLLFHYPPSGITVSHPANVNPAQPGTFTLNRSYPREYDVVTLTVGTWSKNIPYVHPANPITYTLTAAELQQIGDGTHTVSARIVDQLDNSDVSPTSSIVINTAPVEWEDHYTSLADSYNGWIPYLAARSGSIRPHVMNHQLVNAFFNFTDQGAPYGFAGVILYQDFLFIPGQYQFTFEATHVADGSHIPGLVNPILYPDTGMPQWRGVPRHVPKDGVWYVFSIVFTIIERGMVRMYINNDQDGSNGNDFGIRDIRIVRLNSGAGSMSTPAEESDLPVYTGPRPEIKYP
ncbi:MULTISPECIES: hypothetical protein [unclassified Pseudomonas]|uniref:hypothetical protein n=1 Tax=unclassified Pseudomonas TaxID=196821 RepID=UPI00087184C5|nr:MULTISPECIES: hypothetical protein [unclassified Pseudomonas]SCW74584.1 hypothetical protein SAMN03159481_02289 [Pseudomonas sp. NFACC56-3]SFK85225.1 hypothetical protein SAMN03159473_04216 [Pseudomonas sp. NFACC52]